MKKSLPIYFLFSLALCFFNQKVFSQQTNNSTALTNSAAPSASAVTSGGTSINYQTNNAYNNEQGFAPGIFCRTPTIYLGGTLSETDQDNFDLINQSGTNTDGFTINTGILIPFGSKIIDTCKRLAKTITTDREIASQLSLLRACADLQTNGIDVSDKVVKSLPLLAPCLDMGLTASNLIQNNNEIKEKNEISLPSLKPKTIKSL